MVGIRTAKTQEREQLEALQRRASLAWEEYRDVLLAHPDAIELPAEQILAGHVLVAQIAGAIVGFAVVLPRDDGAAELDGLFVEPDRWRQGIGRKLIAKSEKLAALHGAIVLHVIANPLAEAFYVACGFTQSGAAKTRFGSALQMQKTVSR